METEMESIADKSQNNNNKTSTFVASYEVFLKHIEVRKGSEVNVAGIFSPECFQEWLATRKNTLKFPAHSYQRVLYAHLRGADKRRPFEPEIEKQLLKAIRDVKNNPWAIIFENEQTEFGKRGFKRLGFHERVELHQSSKNEAMINTICPESPQDSETSSCLQIYDPISSENSLQLQSQLPETQMFDGNRYFFQTPEQSPRNRTCPWDAIVEVIQKFIPVEYRQESVLIMQERGVNFWSPALIFYLQQMIDSRDIRFSWTFLVPSEDEQHFRNDRPVGSYLITLGNRISHQDEIAGEIFRGSLVGMHSFEVYASMVSFGFACIAQVPGMFGDGNVWQRDVLLRCDGTRMVCLAHIRKVVGGFCVRLQDQSDLFPTVLNTVLLT